MIKKILFGFLAMLLGIIRSAIVGGLIAAATGGPSLDGVGMALFALLYLLPAILLYHFCYALRLKYYIPDILYFVGFISVIALFTYGGSIPSEDGGDNFCRAFLYFSFFSGIAIYFAEVIFRNKKRLKESGCKDEFNAANWRDIFGQILKQPKTIFLYSLRLYVIAAVVMSLAGAGEYFVNLHTKDLWFAVYSLLFSLCLLPGIILYHSAYSLKLKKRICDMVYFVAIIITELLLLLFVANEHMNAKELSFLYVKPSVLPHFGMLVVALGCIAVYMAEVYFRNKAILKMIK
ncbi:MAG: hypothetical protein WC770_01245 [Phycisphaerae bacterium]|jgi:hypothetical protein